MSIPVSEKIFIDQDYQIPSAQLQFASIKSSSPHFSKVEQVFCSHIKHFYSNQDEALRKISDSTDRTCEVLLFNDNPVGFLVYKREKQKEHEIEELIDSFEVKSLVIIEPNDRSREVYGNMLVNRVIKLAQRNFAKNLCITVLERDQKMVEFLKSKGFSVIATWHDKYSEGVKEFLFHINVPEKKITTICQVKGEPRLKENEVRKKRERNRSMAKGSERKEQIAISQSKKRSKTKKKTRSSARKDFHHLTMKKKYIHQIRSEEKTVEGRVSKGAILKYSPGDKIRFYYYSNASDDVTCQIVDIKRFESFREMLVNSGFKNCIPDATSLELAVKAYEQIPKYIENAAQFGVTAIHLKPLT